MEKKYTRISLQNHLLVVSQQTKVPTVFKSISGRGQINGFSKSSSQRMGRYLRSAVCVYRNMVTLTYPHGYPEDGRIFKEHLRRFLQELKREACRHGVGTYLDANTRFSVFWFMEFQERGAPHFHLFTTHNYPKEWIARKWYEIVKSEDDRHLRAGTRIERLRSGRRGTCSYAAKYAAKLDQKSVPDWIKNAGRFWGVVGCRESVAADTLLGVNARKDEKVKRKLKTLRKWLKDYVSKGYIVKIGKGSSVCFYFKSDILVSDCRVMLNQLQMAIINYQDSFAIWDLADIELGGKLDDS